MEFSKTKKTNKRLAHQMIHQMIRFTIHSFISPQQVNPKNARKKSTPRDRPRTSQPSGDKRFSGLIPNGAIESNGKTSLRHDIPWTPKNPWKHEDFNPLKMRVVGSYGYNDIDSPKYSIYIYIQICK